jgi:hypothetical protein
MGKNGALRASGVGVSNVPGGSTLGSPSRSLENHLA